MVTLVFQGITAQKDNFCKTPLFCNAVLYAAALQSNARLINEVKSTPHCFNAQATRDALTHAVQQKSVRAARNLAMLDALNRRRNSEGMFTQSVNGLQHSQASMGTSLAEFSLAMSAAGAVATCQLKKSESINWGMIGSATVGFGTGFFWGWYRYDKEEEKRKKDLNGQFDAAVKKGNIRKVLQLQSSLYDAQHQFKLKVDFDDLSQKTAANVLVGGIVGSTAVPYLNGQCAGWQPATMTSVFYLSGYVGRSAGKKFARWWIG